MTSRALLGGKLTGRNLVRIAYIDESGVSDRRQEPILVVGGVLVHGDHQLDKLESALQEIAKKHIPEEYRDGLVLHTSEIYNGHGKIFDKRLHPEWTVEKRMALLIDLAKLPAKLNLQVVSAHVKRAHFVEKNYPIPSEKKPDPTLAAHLCAFMACAMEVELWMRQNAKLEHCLMIVEDNQHARKVIKETQRDYQNQSFAALFEEKHKKYFPFKKIKEDPAFQSKRPSHPLVLADFIAYVMKRFIMKDPMINPYFEPWKKSMAGLRVKLPS